MTNTPSYCFGYGSLVNRDTHVFGPCYRAEIVGWKRKWSHWVDAPYGETTSLTVFPDAHARTKGLIMATPQKAHAGLDARETGYDRHLIEAEHLDHDGPDDLLVELYQSRRQRPGSADAPILQSYLDTVLLGFQREFGEAGIAEFINTTDGWETPVLRDRAAPIYPRTADISQIQAAAFDAQLSAFGINWIDGST